MLQSEVRRIDALPPGLPILREDGLLAGIRLVEALERDWANGSLRFAGPDEALFAAFEGSRLVGVCGVTADPYATIRVARLRRLYVHSAHRRRGHGQGLVAAVAEQARGFRFPSLRARGPAEALGFLEACGFRAVPQAVGSIYELRLEGEGQVA